MNTSALHLLERFKPGAPKRSLFFAGALVWGGAGLLLCFRGLQIVGEIAVSHALLVCLAIVLGIVLFRVMLLRVSRKHIHRVAATTRERPCVFSFLDWRGYGLMSVMITGGVLLRVSGVLPPPFLGVTYVAMGTALVLAAGRFLAAGLQFATTR